MGLTATTSGYTTLPVGGQWEIGVEYRDIYGYLAAASPSVVITLPDGTTGTAPTFTIICTGHYLATFTTAATGLHLAHVTIGTDALDFAAYASAPTSVGGLPSPADVDAYLGGTSASEAMLQTVIDAEAAAQRAICDVGPDYPPDLREALLRRVARNLAMRGLPLAVLTGDADAGSGILPGRDPEVRRLEAPHRRRVVG